MIYKNFEIHITIDPCKIELDKFKICAKTYNFKVAELLKRTGQHSDKDEFCTGHTKNYKEAKNHCKLLIELLKQENFNIRTFKIEHILLDSRKGDIL